VTFRKKTDHGVKKKGGHNKASPPVGQKRGKREEKKPGR